MPGKADVTARKKAKGQPAALHPINPLPSLRIRLHLLRRNTAATDFGLHAIFAPRAANSQSVPRP